MVVSGGCGGRSVARRRTGTSLYGRSDERWVAATELKRGDRRRRRKYLYGKTQREVRQQLAVYVDNHDPDLSGSSGPDSVEHFLEEWLRDVAAAAVRPRTFLGYRQLLLGHVVPSVGQRALAELHPREVQALYRTKLATGLSPQTVRNLHSVLHRALSHAVRWGLMPRNVCSLVDPPRIRKHEIRPLDADAARRLLAAAAETDFKALYVLALTTGMRLGELLGLKWSDIDLEGARLQVRRSLQRLPRGGFIEVEPKSARSRRSIDLTASTVASLEQHRARQTQEQHRVGAAWEDRGLVFCNRLGRPLEPGNVKRRSFWPLLERAGLPRIRFHDLRHSAASLLLSLNEHPKIVQELLGHSQIGITLDTYSHLIPGLQRQAIARLDDLLRAHGANHTPPLGHGAAPSAPEE
jgi:integrase